MTPQLLTQTLTQPQSQSQSRPQPRQVKRTSSLSDVLGPSRSYFASSTEYQEQDTDSDTESPDGTPLFTAGVIADIQYAPIPDGFSFSGAPRFYQYSLVAARAAAAHFHRHDVPILLQLGDIVDGKCQDIVGHGGTALKKNKKDPSESDQGESDSDSDGETELHIGQTCVEHVMEALSEYTTGCDARTVIHTYGNHCLYNLDRPRMQKLLGLPFVRETETDQHVGYFSHVHQNVRFIVIDSYDICLMQRSQSSTKWKKADEIMRANNPNYPDQENSPVGLEGLQMRFVGFNGGVDEPQLAWLRDTLRDAQDLDQKVIILSHQPIHPTSTSPVCLMWNYDEVLEILRSFRTTVIASFSGHAHKGGYQRDEESGIHFRVVEAALEHKPETYALLDVFDDRIVLRGQGCCKSGSYDFDHMTEDKWTPAPVPVEAATEKL